MRTVIARMAFVAYLTLCLWLLVVPAASAYIDPGSGSVIFQAVIAGFLAGGLAFKTFWRRIKAFFTGSKSTTSER